MKLDGNRLNDEAMECIQHIDHALELLSKSLKNKDRYYVDEMGILSIQKLLENIGEAFRHICKRDEDAKSKLIGVDIKGWIGMKNVLNHSYFQVDYDEILNAVTLDAPRLNVQLNKIYPELVKNHFECKLSIEDISSLATSGDIKSNQESVAKILAKDDISNDFDR